MRIRTILLITAAVLLVEFRASGQVTTGVPEMTSDEIRKIPITLHLQKAPLWKIVNRLSYIYRVRIGFEGSVLDSDHQDYYFKTALVTLGEAPMERVDRVDRLLATGHLFTLDVDRAPLEDVMDSIVNAMENYSWTIEDGVVNIVPKKGRDERYAKLMELKIKEFRIRSPQLMDFREAVHQLPEVQKFLADNGLSWPANRPLPYSLDREIPGEIEIRDVTFRQLLNRITLIKGGGWIVEKYTYVRHTNGDYLLVDI